MALLSLCWCLLLPPVARAQAVYGSIFGTVTDQSGAAVSGAKMTMTSVQKGTKFETTTNGTGKLQCDSPDSRSVQRSLRGRWIQSCRIYEHSRVCGPGGESRRKTSVGANQEELTVSAEDMPLMKTDRSDVATMFTREQVENLPLFSRNFTSLELLTPGTSQLGWQHVSAENPQGGIQIMVNGNISVHFVPTGWHG